MSRQHASPLLLDAGRSSAIPLISVPLSGSTDQISEAQLQQIIHDHPQCLPIAEIDAVFADPVPICIELQTNVGRIDNFMVTASGLPILVECKLWRNAESRREVIGQILDYAKALSLWSAADVQGRARQALSRDDDPVPALVRAAGWDINDVVFADALTANLRRGRFLLLIVGDGIREGVESIAEYLQRHAGLHFSFGLVEMPLFDLPTGERLLLPRVIAKTEVIRRLTISTPAEMLVEDESSGEPTDVAPDEMTQDRVRFWSDFVSGLQFDDPEQPVPNVSRQGYVYILTPVPGGSLWITVFRSIRDGKVGLFLSYHRNSPGERIALRLAEDSAEIVTAIGGTAALQVDPKGRKLIGDSFAVGSLTKPDDRVVAIDWLKRRANDFVNVLRPRIRAALADLQGD